MVVLPSTVTTFNSRVLASNPAANIVVEPLVGQGHSEAALDLVPGYKVVDFIRSQFNV